MKNFAIWAVVIGVIGYGVAKLYLHNEVSDTMDMAVVMMSPYAHVEYEGIGSTLSGELTVDGVRIVVDGFRDAIYIDRIGIDTPSFLSLLNLSDLTKVQSDGMPEYLGFLAEGVRIPADADYYEEFYDMTLQLRDATDADSAANECVGKYGFSPTALQGLGYTDQVMSMKMAFSDDESRFSFDMNVSMEDMWDMNVTVTLIGNMMSELMRGAMAQPKLRDIRLEYTDRSLNERVARYCEERGLSAAEILHAQLDSFKFIGTSNGIEFDQYMLDPYKEFLLGKSTLIVTARPTEPVAFSQIDLYKPSDVPALLNLAAIAR
ncbi:MAG: hypothetical protein OEM60_07325 [Gammaproteobacteria bacterium]|nr:hypothetical protein [Gammaproteobacteria bacterium]MDH3433650.1 hypothetical protein [Gammaproteobacteria bacterium]